MNEIKKCCGNCKHFAPETSAEEQGIPYGDCLYPVHQFTPIFEAVIGMLPYAYKSNLQNLFDDKSAESIEFIEATDGTDCSCFEETKPL